MQPARRRTSSKATINYGSRNSSYPEGKSLTGFLDQAERDPNSISWRSCFGNLRAVRRASRKNPLFIIIGLLFICWISLPTIRASTRVANRHSALVTYPKPFPNFESLPIGGKRALEALHTKGSPISCPSQATFVIPLADRNLRSTIPLIARLQETSCPIHLLVERDQLKETEDVLQVVLPATELIVIVAVMFESGGVALTTLHHVKSVQTPWVWLMGPADGKTWRTLDLDDFARGVQKFPRADFPLGIYGARVHESRLSCVPQTNRPEPVAFLVPPLLAPTSLLLRAELGIISGTSDNIWASLGGNIARVTGLGMGGALAPAAYFNLETCQTPHTWTVQGHQVSKAVVDLLDAQLRSSTSDAVRYAFMLPNMQSLHLLAPTACRMIQNGHDVHISIRTNSSERGSSRQQLDFGCHLHYYPDAPITLNEGKFELAHSINMWCLSITPETKVIIATELDDDFGRDQLAFIKRLCPGATVAINLPFNDLQDSEWLSMLTPQEWQAWNTPQIELAVVTHDRPWSLARLLNSIKRAHYFGDAVNVVVNLEQTADLQTRRIAETFSMNLNSGHVAVRHRIVYAGLMTAVVESWHPHGNHFYGVILEDDVELSPMFYAWVKFCVLRYRYDTRNNQSSQLYGVSLYQPKVTELRMEGRRMFDPKDIFSKLELEYPHTPYLSQVPCSWGAVYFPEHWREFQRYLALRLSEYSMPVNEIVVPNLRSNKWSRSWKKFFNEMVFLRGYVSLYPNYDHFVSLSTNHLEMGEHVPANVNQEKQAQYFLPLMQDTAIARLYPGTERGVKFLDLPKANLPLWSTLPVLDLWGDVSSLEKLQAIGLAWRANMSICNPDESYEDALQFLCPSGKNTNSFNKSYKSLSSTPVDNDGPDLMQG